jgi:osmotically-inducible protein OsmY
MATAAVACACGAREPRAISLPTPSYTARAPSTPDATVVADERIVHVARRELDRDPIVGKEGVHVDSQDGVLTLEGAVVSVMAKERAVGLAHVVRGVRAIVDRLVVVSEPSTTDEELELVVAGALGRDPVTAGQAVAAACRNAVVRLWGGVDSNAARRVAEADVLAIPGVVDVIDDLAVFPEGRTDARLAAEAQRLLGDDPWVASAGLGVSASGGSVVLDGSVGSTAERVRAEADARAASPARVDASHVRVDGHFNDGTLRASPEVSRRDGDLEHAVLDVFVRDPRVHPFAPGVDVRSGVVVLTGVAPDSEVAHASAEDARNVPGVQGVRDQMRVADTPAGPQPTDARIHDTVIDALTRDAALSAAHLSATVVDGRVSLRGTVPTEADRLHAMAVAASTMGVRDVDDGLVVAPPRLGLTGVVSGP